MSEKASNPDFYFNESGLLVMTAAYLIKRGNCCGNGCTHCPYNYIAVPEPYRSDLLAKRAETNPPEQTDFNHT